MGNVDQLECGPIPNLMVALPNTGGALCSTPQSLANAQYRCRAVITQDAKPVEICMGASNYRMAGWISAVSRPKFTILWGHVEDILLLNKYLYIFSIVDTCLSCKDIARESCGMVPRWRFLASFLGLAFAASRVQHISDLHSEFALGTHHVSKYGRHPICGR